MPATPNSMYNTNIEYFLREELEGMGANIASMAEAAPTAPIPVQSTPVYDTVSGGPAYLVVFDDGSTGYFSDPQGTTPLAGVVPSSTNSGVELAYVHKVDDVAGDQSGSLINYTEVRLVDPLTGLTTLLETLTEDLSAPYVITGTPRNSSEIGVDAKTAIFAEMVSGSWIVGPLTESFAYTVVTVADPLTPPTLTDSDGNVTPLFQGESANFSLAVGTHEIAQPNITITAGAGDTVKVFGTKYTA